MEIRYQRPVAIIRKDTLIDMHEYGTGRRLVGSNGRRPAKKRLLEKLIPKEQARESETKETPAEKMFLEYAGDFILPDNYADSQGPLTFGLAVTKREMFSGEIYAELNLGGWYPAGFGQAMCYFHDLSEEENRELGKVAHLGTLFLSSDLEQKVILTLGKKIDGFKFPYGPFGAGTQIVVIKEEKTAPKK